MAGLYLKEDLTTAITSAVEQVRGDKMKYFTILVLLMALAYAKSDDLEGDFEEEEQPMDEYWESESEEISDEFIGNST